MAFEPYFYVSAEEGLTNGFLQELKTLEIKGELTSLEKKRLLDLYSLEVRTLKPGHPRVSEISDSIERLRPDVDGFQSEIGKLKTEILLTAPSEVEKPFSKNAKLKKAWQAAYQAWNKDENEKALEKAQELVRSEELKALASKVEWTKILNLEFRIATDLNLRPKMLEAYNDLKQFDTCSAEAAQAAFILALLSYSEKDDATAKKIFSEQCDPDESLSNRLKRAYWDYRFNEKDPVEGPKALARFRLLPTPGYYAYLLHSSKHEKLDLKFKEDAVPIYLRGNFKVDNQVHEIFLKAEECLKNNLRRDAAIYTLKAALLMKDDPKRNLFPLLYAAHLLRASGNHLESMRIFTLITNSLKPEDTYETAVLEAETVRLYPKPFLEIVDWAGKQWGVDPDFVYSIMRQESAFNPLAVSSADARGLMQMMPQLGLALWDQWKWKKQYSARLLFNGAENIKIATFHLHQLQTLSPHFALMAAAYNAGIRRVYTWWNRYGELPLDIFVELIPISETRNYVKLVLRNYLYYKAIRTGGEIEPNLISLELPTLGRGGEPLVKVN